MISHAGLWPRGRVALALALGCLLSRSAEAQVYRLAELNIDQIRMLDRQRTVILLPGGVLEEHGPYLPSFTDGYRNEHLTEDLRPRSRSVRVGPRSCFRSSRWDRMGRTGSVGSMSFPGRIRSAPPRCGRSSWILRLSLASKGSDGSS